MPTLTTLGTYLSTPTQGALVLVFDQSCQNTYRGLTRCKAFLQKNTSASPSKVLKAEGLARQDWMEGVGGGEACVQGGNFCKFPLEA